MNRRKDEDKIIWPMFPRFHVNDTEKGGPRGPPRNKMAVYEQLSFPSQRFNHANNNSVNSEAPLSQGSGNERDMFHSYQLPTQHQSEKLYSQYCDLSIPLSQVEPKKKFDEDDFRVPIFIQSLQNQEHSKCASDLSMGKLSSSNPSNFNRPINFHQFKKMGMLESITRQVGKSQKEDISKEISTDRVKATSTEEAEGLKKRPDSVCLEPTDNPANSIDRLATHDLVDPELRANSKHVFGENFAAFGKINSSDRVRASPSEDQKGAEDKSFRAVHKRKMGRVESVSGTSVVDSINILDITPDDVVGIIGRKCFWKARKAIFNQQRVFAVQVFELHRLVKVQKLIAASPQFLVDESSYLGRSTKASPGAKIPLNCSMKAIPNVSKQTGEPEKPSQKKEISAENTIRKPSFSSFQNSAPQPSHCPLNGPASANTNAQPWCFNQPQGHQWLIPVMSPSEGLVYKPYPGPSPACTGFDPNLNHLTGSFLTPAYGIPAPPYFPPVGPHGYLPTYGVPNGGTVSGSSVEQPNPPPNPIPISAGDSHHHWKNRASPDALNSLFVSKDAEVQASTTSIQVERLQDSRGEGDDAEIMNVLPLFPMAPATGASNSNPNHPKRSRPIQVIKVVPHNARSATESAARIFQSIQEERKQHDAVQVV